MALVARTTITGFPPGEGPIRPGESIEGYGLSQEQVERLVRLGAVSEESTPKSEYGSQTRPELIALARAQGLEVAKSATKAQLVAILEATDADRDLADSDEDLDERA